MAEDIAVRIRNLSKYYQIYETPRDRLKQFVLPRLHRVMGLPSKQYFREFRALNDVSFEVRKGEAVGIVGRNGSGKSTLLQIICGTLTPTSGTVETRGRIAALLELGSGFHPDFTGRENVYLNASVLGLSNEETESCFDDIAKFADIGEFIDQPVKTYSSGMVVRLAFAVAINVDPEILIIDEALAVGDELFQRKCFSRIEAIRATGATILFVSHAGSTVVELCDRALLLDKGEKLRIGSAKAIVGEYQRLLYAPTERQSAIRAEIGSLCDGLDKGSSVQNPKRDATEPIQHPATDAELDEEFLDPHLESQSVVSYESRGPRIESAEILTLSGKRVNCLTRGKSYRYAYRVEFNTQSANVRFGMLIKTASGVELGGAVSAPSVNQGVPFVESGTTMNVEFLFVCSLNPGIYFLNAGVTGALESEETYLHRVLDICTFRVLPITNDTATAIVHLKCAPSFQLVDGTSVRRPVA
ncbi:MAG: ABC transporter ATP-binding protein [Sulfuritalea sp.]|nr:ABC transporter ATP-binding protein [Sulfuritalea sp.]